MGIDAISDFLKLFHNAGSMTLPSEDLQQCENIDDIAPFSR